MAFAYRLDAISQDPINSISRAQTLPLALVMDAAASKALRTGPYTIGT